MNAYNPRVFVILSFIFVFFVAICSFKQRTSRYSSTGKMFTARVPLSRLYRNHCNPSRDLFVSHKTHSVVSTVEPAYSTSRNNWFFEFYPTTQLLQQQTCHNSTHNQASCTNTSASFSFVYTETTSNVSFIILLDDKHLLMNSVVQFVGECSARGFPASATSDPSTFTQRTC